MATKVDICNFALAHLAVGKTISNFDTDRTAEAAACRLFYDQVREELLRSFPWPFAKRFAALAVVEEDPSDSWLFSYRYPTDALRLIDIFSGTRVDSRATLVRYHVGRDGTGKLIYTDQADAILNYIEDIDAPYFDPDFTSAFSYLLASRIAPLVTGGDQFKLGERSLQLAQFYTAQARQNALNEQHVDEDPISDLERSR